MKKAAVVPLVGFALAFAAAASFAGSDPGSWYLAPEAMGVWADEDRTVDDDVGLQLALGKVLSQDWDAEIAAFTSKHDAEVGNSTLKLRGFSLGVHRVFYRDARIHPYFALALGRLEAEGPLSRDDSSLFASYGVGLLADLAKRPENGTNVQLRGEILGRHAFDDVAHLSDPVDYVTALGVQFSWGGSRRSAAPEPAPQPEPAPVDTDSDGDGVVDRLDKCPGTPAGAKVDAVGCELDLDADDDGVNDDQDKCPGTPKGDRVDVNGCTIKDEIRLPRVVFETDKAALLPESYPILDEAVATLKKHPDLRIEVAGHTDSRGSDAYNLSLSDRRAATVLKYLKDAGVANELTSRGYGESEPIADNTTEDGRQQNRRVGLRILN